MYTFEIYKGRVDQMRVSSNTDPHIAQNEISHVAGINGAAHSALGLLTGEGKQEYMRGIFEIPQD